MQSNNQPNLEDPGNSIKKRMQVFAFQQSFRGEGTVRPVDEILALEADKISTLAAISWSEARELDKPFSYEGCIAEKVGQEEVSERLDQMDHFLNKYLIAKKDGKVSSAAIKELFNQFVSQDEFFSSRGHDKKIKTSIMSHPRFKEVVKYNKNLNIDNNDKSCRGYEGVSFNKEAILEDFPEIEQETLNLVTLRKELSI